MKILVNAIPLTGLLTGISRYLRSLYGSMAAFPGVEPTYFWGRDKSGAMPPQAEPGPWIKKTSLIWKLPDPAVFALRSAFWLNFERRMKRECRKNSYDVYHETAFVPAAVTGVPIVYTIYDLSLIKFRDKHPRERVWFFDFFFKRRLPYAAHVLTISEFIRSEIISEIGLPPDMVTAVPLAPSGVFGPRTPEQVAEAKKALSLPKDYLLFVGSLEPRKNLTLLTKAMARASSDIPLVLIGWDGWGDQGWREEVASLGLEGRVVMPGYVDDETLARVYCGATAFVFPSLYEGFGLPLLEAMTCGCPVISSSAASLPEVGGDAALYVDPHDAGGLALAIDKVAQDSELQADLREKGLKRAASFTWERSARLTMDVFAKAAGGGK